MFENPRRGRQARNFTTNVPKILDLKSSSEQIFSLGAPDVLPKNMINSQDLPLGCLRRIKFASMNISVEVALMQKK